MAVPSTKIIHGKLIGLKNNLGGYISYIFLNLDSNTVLDKYIMCTRFPNWESPFIKLGDTGYVKYREVFGGVDEWYDKEKEIFIKYNYTDIHFLDFVYDKEKPDEITL